MFKKIISASLLTVLTACTSVGNIQRDCEKQYSKFEDIVNCTKAALAGNSSAEKDASVKLYFLEAEQLIEKINKGVMTEGEAKLEWQRLFVNLKNKEESRRPVYIQNNNSQNYTVPRPRQTVCTPMGNSVSCNTY